MKCRSQRALLKVLSNVGDKPRPVGDSSRRSTAWSDDSQQQRKLTESVSCLLTASIGTSVAGLRNSLSAGNLRDELAADKPSVGSDSDAKSLTPRRGRRAVTDVRHLATKQSPPTTTSVAVEKQSTETDVLIGHSGQVRQSRGGRSRRRPVMVRLELLANWGHERLVGLTEIELLDARGRRIDINPSCDVSVSAAFPVSQTDALFNGKCKVCTFVQYC